MNKKNSYFEFIIFVVLEKIISLQVFGGFNRPLIN